MPRHDHFTFLVGVLSESKGALLFSRGVDEGVEKQSVNGVERKKEHIDLWGHQYVLRVVEIGGSAGKGRLLSRVSALRPLSGSLKGSDQSAWLLWTPSAHAYLCTPKGLAECHSAIKFSPAGTIRVVIGLLEVVADVPISSPPTVFIG